MSALTVTYTLLYNFTLNGNLIAVLEQIKPEQIGKYCVQQCANMFCVGITYCAEFKTCFLYETFNEIVPSPYKATYLLGSYAYEDYAVRPLQDESINFLLFSKNCSTYFIINCSFQSTVFAEKYFDKTRTCLSNKVNMGKVSVLKLYCVNKFHQMLYNVN